MLYHQRPYEADTRTVFALEHANARKLALIQLNVRRLLVFFRSKSKSTIRFERREYKYVFCLEIEQCLKLNLKYHDDTTKLEIAL